jgi:lipopolysaccharide transport system permease protein
MKQLIELFSYRELIYNLAMKQIKVNFKQSVLGFVWAILKPACTVLILTVVFSRIAKFPSDGIPYPLFAFGALIPWTFFTTMVGAGVPSLVNNAHLIKKIYFPREVLPISTIIGASLDVVISAIIFIGLLAFYRVGITLNILFIIPIFAIEFLFGFGLVLLLGTVNVWYRDVNQAVSLLLQFWMYLTPIIYPFSMVPEKYKVLYVMNPMVGIVEGFRNAVIKGITPDMGLLGISTAIGAVTFVIGYLVFKSNEFDFADVI